MIKKYYHDVMFKMFMDEAKFNRKLVELIEKRNRKLGRVVDSLAKK